MDLNALLRTYKPPPDPAEYWFDHVYHLYKLGLPIDNPYPDIYTAHRAIRKAMETILILLKEHGKITEEAFADAKRESIS
ncbi:hypothetical protein LCGC14_2583180, partial [marine sediment metagenome]